MHRLWSALVLLALCAVLAPATHAQTPPRTPLPAAVTLANGVRVAFRSVTYNADGTSTWRYHVAANRDLIAWLLQLPSCATATAATPDPWTAIGSDPVAGFGGVAWNPAAPFTGGEFTLTLSGPVLLDRVRVAANDGTLAHGTIAGPVCGAAAPVSITLSNGYRITLLSVTAGTGGVSTWRYRVDELPGAQDLSNWVLELEGCVVVTAAPAPWEIVHPDPNAGLNGVKWQTGAGFQRGEFSVTLGELPVIGLVRAAAKGPDVVRGALAGPLCSGAEDEPEREPPAVIVVYPPQTRIVVEGGVSVAVAVIKVDNTGGDARGMFLTIELDDDDLELIDLVYLERIGYIKERGNGKIVIGLGQNNVMRRDHPVTLQIKFKGKRRDAIRTTLRYSVAYHHTGGSAVTAPVVVDLTLPPVAPVVVAPVRLSVERIDVRFRARWNRGGLRIYGLPLSEPATLRSGIVVQYFERARFEYHPALASTPNAVLLGLLGVELVGVQPPQPPPTSTAELRWYFAPTGHMVAPPFRTFWQARGGLLAFGYPIGVAFVDANGRLVQYFERARLELHPELEGTEYAVQLGLLGEELLVRRGGRLDD
ncbi:MAG TPA: hypothetical protein VNL77_07585 [Roseiflexaceae bacterium]|nr:hypothetical protein [Roseiflexaceae bacterium]